MSRLDPNYLTDLILQVGQIIGILRRLQSKLQQIEQLAQTGNGSIVYHEQPERWYRRFDGHDSGETLSASDAGENLAGSELTDTGYTYAELDAALKNREVSP